MSPTAYRSWQAPSADADMKYRLGWLDEACQEGQLWQQGQRGYKSHQTAFNIISGDDSRSKVTVDYHSKLTGHRLKTNSQVMVSGLSNIRPIWGWHSTNEFAGHAQMMNKTSRALYLRGYWDQDLKSALMWALVSGVGFVRPVYRRRMAGRGHGEIQIDTCGARSVLPVQMPEDGDWNNAYAVTYLDEQPIWMAHGTFWKFQDQLKPTSSVTWYSSEIGRASSQNLLHRATSWFGRKTPESQGELYIPIRYTRVNDQIGRASCRERR